MREKPKQGLGEEAKNGFISCFTSLLILISIPVGVLLLCVVVFIIDSNAKAAEAVAEIEPIVQETCNISDYQSNMESYDIVEGYYWDLMEEKNLVAACFPLNKNWNCECFAPPD